MEKHLFPLRLDWKVLNDCQQHDQDSERKLFNTARISEITALELEYFF